MSPATVIIIISPHPTGTQVSISTSGTVLLSQLTEALATAQAMVVNNDTATQG